MGDWKNKSLLQKTCYSLNGFVTAFKCEKAIRLESLMLLIFTALAAYMGLPGKKVAAIFLSCLIPITTELINTAAESMIDLLLGQIFREDVRRAKDMLSASVLLSLLIGYGFAIAIIFF